VRSGLEGSITNVQKPACDSNRSLIAKVCFSRLFDLFWCDRLLVILYDWAMSVDKPLCVYISFRDYPIGSISVSGHKFIGSPVTYGIVLTHQPYVKKIETSVEYIGSKDMTILGSRSGLAALFLWYAIQTRSQHFHKEVANCLQNARYLRDRLLELDYHPLLNDFSTTVVFDKPAIELCRKWQLATQGNIAHIVVMQHISTQKIDQFIDNLLVKNKLSCFSTSCL
jgi:glutamate/tyrosine decarboxylase-like PLP-dependent enzyme